MNAPVKIRWSRTTARALGVAGALLALGVLLSSPRVSARPEGRALSAVELAGIFGDAPAPAGSDPCKKSYACNDSFVEGASDCARCEKTDARLMCCPLGTGTQCDYSGASVCQNNKRYVGTISGGAGTCGSCTSANQVQSGTCATLRDAGSGAGPCP